MNRAKVAAEQAVWARHALGFPVTVLLAQQLLKGEYVLQGHGQGSWPYVHVDNLAEAVVLAARSARAVGQAYNIVDGQTTAQAFTDHFRQWPGVGPLPLQPEFPALVQAPQWGEGGAGVVVCAAGDVCRSVTGGASCTVRVRGASPWALRSCVR